MPEDTSENSLFELFQNALAQLSSPWNWNYKTPPIQQHSTPRPTNDPSLYKNRRLAPPPQKPVGSAPSGKPPQEKEPPKFKPMMNLRGAMRSLKR